MAASSHHTPGLQARQDDETSSSSEIEDSDQSTEQALLDSSGETNPDPAGSTTAEMTPPISVNKSPTPNPGHPPAPVVPAATGAKSSPSTSLSSPSLSSNSSTGISGTNSTNIITGADLRQPPSRLTLTYPKPSQANLPLFAIGNSIDFTWKFDKATLTAPPVSLTLQVTLNSDATWIWPIANISGTSTSYTWNTANIKTPSNLLMGVYTFNIFDAKIGKLGTASGGQLMPNSDLRFGLYIPESRIPGASKVQCGTCEFASSMASIQRQAITPLIVVVVGIVTLVMTFS
ncbi:hypothetical protein BGZ97_004832 [Linnemannia gamsii]|uniref:DUF7137 domain-containing protein n=1 Tax=Linnemannia gamsii TaxID=64522 RepID=A0A9P6RFV8_9FUNG|nr:hypothetical protein BGZ97_004832 [Linnemannia gamsii]